MSRYEILFLTIPEITEDESSSLEKHFDKVVSDVKGEVISYERWGKYKLAYPIRKYDYGVYYLMRFDVDDTTKEALIEVLKTSFQVKYIELVMRSMLGALDMRDSLEYKRPESLEETPSAEIESFLKESKSFLAGSSSKQPSDKARHNS